MLCLQLRLASAEPFFANVKSDFSFLEELKTAIGQDWTGAAVAVYRPHSPDVPWIVDGLDVYPGVPNSLRSFSRGSAIGFVEL